MRTRSAPPSCLSSTIARLSRRTQITFLQRRSRPQSRNHCRTHTIGTPRTDQRHDYALLYAPAAPHAHAHSTPRTQHRARGSNSDGSTESSANLRSRSVVHCQAGIASVPPYSSAEPCLVCSQVAFWETLLPVDMSSMMTSANKSTCRSLVLRSRMSNISLTGRNRGYLGHDLWQRVHWR